MCTKICVYKQDINQDPTGIKQEEINTQGKNINYMFPRPSCVTLNPLHQYFSHNSCIYTEKYIHPYILKCQFNLAALLYQFLEKVP